MENKKDKKINKFDINEWVPPNPLIHELKVKKELLSLGDKAKWFCISRWWEMQIQEQTVLHIKNMRKIHSSNQKWLREDQLTYPNTVIAKIYFPITDELNFKKINMGFKTKEGKTYPRLGISIPDKLYIDFTFPNLKNKKEITVEHKKRLLEMFKEINIINYIPHRTWDEEQGDMSLLPSGEKFEDGKTYVLLTDKNWKILTTNIPTDELNEYLQGIAPEWAGVDHQGYYTPEYIASSGIIIDRERNDPDIINDKLDVIEALTGLDY